MAQTKLTDLPEVLVADNAMEVLVEDAGTVKKITRANFVDGLASAGTTTSGGTSAGGGIGAGGAVELIALGDLTAGDAVVLNSDGTVSAVGETMTEMGSNATFITPAISTGTAIKIQNSIYDSVREQSIIFYTVGNANILAKDRVGTTEIKYIVGHSVLNTVVDDEFIVDIDASLSVTDFLWGGNFLMYGYIATCIAGDKILIWYDTEGGAKFQVGTLTAGAIQWNAAQAFNGGMHATIYDSSAFYDSVNDKVVLGYGHYDPDVGGYLGGYTMYGQNLTTPIDPYTVSRHQNNGGRRAIGIYNFDGASLTMDGDIFYPPVQALPPGATWGEGRRQAFMNCSAIHAYTPSGTFIDWRGEAGETLAFDLDVYQLIMDGAVFLGWNGASGREWVEEHMYAGGFLNSLRLTREKISTAWDTGAATSATIGVMQIAVPNTLPVQYQYTSFLSDAWNLGAVRPIRQDTLTSAPYTQTSGITENEYIWAPGGNYDSQLIYMPSRGVITHGVSKLSSHTGRTYQLVKAPQYGVTIPNDAISFHAFNPSGMSHFGTTGTGSSSSSGHVVTNVDKQLWIYSDYNNINAVLFDPGKDEMVSSLADGYFLGFAADNFLDGDASLILTVGSIENTHTGLVPGTAMWLGTDGSLQTGEGELSIFAGTALTTNKLLVRF
jgi:hypothetical protein